MCGWAALRPSRYARSKVLGGVYGIAATRKVLDLKGLAGLSVRSLMLAMCHLFMVTSTLIQRRWAVVLQIMVPGNLPGLEPPAYDSEEGQSQVLNAGGVYETLAGSHSESKVMINLIPKPPLCLKRINDSLLMPGLPASST